MKNTVKNNTSPLSNPPLPDLLTPVGSKPIAGTHATAAQLSDALDMPDIDDTFLRNRAKDGVIPKPRNNQFEINPTVLGLLKWYRDKSETKSDLPAQYANMQAMENALGTDKKTIKWLLRNGAGEAQDPSNRIAPLPVIRRAFEIVAKVADGRLSGIEGFEEWDKDTELAQKLREEREALQRKALIEKGELLMASDGKFAVWKLDALEMFRELFEAPVKTGIAKLAKTINRQHKTIIGDEEKSRRCAVVVTAAIAAVLDKLREKIPANKTASEPDES